jgi:hypothetical protein
MLTILGQLVLGFGMSLIGWWLWRDADANPAAAAEVEAGTSGPAVPLPLRNRAA